MEANKILSADILDLVFENRNKAYGAYDLRKTYHKRIVTALIIAASFALLIFLITFLSSTFSSGPAKVEVQEVKLENVVEEKKPEPPPPPPPPKQPPPPKVEMTKFTPPKIVKDEEVKKEDIPPKNEEIVNVAKVNQEGSKIEIPPTPDEGKGVVQAPADNTNYDQTFTKVEVEASAPSNWGSYLQRTLQVPGDAPPGTYTVPVRFIVDKEGKVSDVKAMEDPGYGFAEEAVRAVRNGPKWSPGIQNGHQVASYRVQPIKFVVSE